MNIITIEDPKARIAVNLKREAQLADPESLRRMVHLIDPKDGDVVCDTGAGKGNVSMALAPKVTKVLAFDITDFCSRAFKEKGLKNVEFKQADLSDGTIPCSDGSEFAEHVKRSIWEMVFKWFPEPLQQELHLQPENDEGWFSYNCIELVPRKS